MQAAIAPTAPAPAREPDDTESTGLHHVQREHILRVLHATHWVIEGNAGAAIKLGMKPATLRHRMKKLGITRAQVAQSGCNPAGARHAPPPAITPPPEWWRPTTGCPSGSPANYLRQAVAPVTTPL